MTLDRKTLERVITNTLAPAGFERRGRGWYLSGAECVGVVELDRSPVAASFTILLGTSPRSLEPVAFPRANECDIYGSLGSLVGHDRWPLETLWPESSKYSDADRRNMLAEVLRDEVVPFLTSLQTLSGIRRAISDGTLKRFFVTLKLKALVETGADAEARRPVE